MKKKIITTGLFLCLLFSCSRKPVEKPLEPPVLDEWAGAVPMAILQTGEQPLWFQLTESGPVHIESIEDAVFSRAFVPWPYAPHIRFLQKRDGALVMAANRDGFLKIAPNEGKVRGLALYRFSGGEFFREYTIGGFVFNDEKPAAVLYLDNIFLSVSSPLPNPRAWTFNMESNAPFPLEIPALRLFPEDEGWNADTLRPGNDGLFYYRVAKKSGWGQTVRMFRTDNLSQEGEEISIGVFYNSAPREIEISDPSLPPLPQGFLYTGIEFVGDSVFACWEEQEDFSIGAAGFVVVKNR